MKKNGLSGSDSADIKVAETLARKGVCNIVKVPGCQEMRVLEFIIRMIGM
jgi:hypothetical protein